MKETNEQQAITGLLRPSVLLDILANFTPFATDKQKQRLKIVCRYQQHNAANRIVQRVLADYLKKGRKKRRHRQRMKTGARRR